MEPSVAYFTSMTIVRSRLLAAKIGIEGETPLSRAERLALHARKIVESVSYSALSGLEVRSYHVLREKRSQDADKVLTWLERKNLLKLPSAQRLGAPVAGFKIVFEGSNGAASGLDLSADDLREIYSRASGVIHERHPERLTSEWIEQALSAVENDIKRLHSWLWLHIIFLKGSGFLIQMGQYGTDSFMGNVSRESD